MKTAHHLERPRRSHGDVARPVRLESESSRVDFAQRFLCSRVSNRRDCEPVHPVAVPGKLLEMVEMEPHLVFASRNVSGVSPAFHDRRDYDRVSVLSARPRRYSEPVADANPSIFGEAFVNCDCAVLWRLKKKERRGEVSEHPEN